jgi:hypothetical protein
MSRLRAKRQDSIAMKCDAGTLLRSTTPNLRIVEPAEDALESVEVNVVGVRTQSTGNSLIVFVQVLELLRPVSFDREKRRQVLRQGCEGMGGDYRNSASLGCVTWPFPAYGCSSGRSTKSSASGGALAATFNTPHSPEITTVPFHLQRGRLPGEVPFTFRSNRGYQARHPLLSAHRASS